MKAHVTSRDENGKPLTVEISDGFMFSHGPYDPKEHGWVDNQLDISKFSIIQAGWQMEQLVNEVNDLRRENWQLQQNLKQWMKAAGFGD